VREAIRIDDAVEIFRAGYFDLVVICHSIPEPDRLRLIDAVRMANPSAKIIIIRIDGELSTKLADETVHSLDGAEALLEAIKQTLSDSSQT
jgi:DNA-binding NarL/FixJ family response regulator